MVTLSEINFNYDRAVRQAERLEEMSARLERTADRDMEDLLDGIYRAWKSASATAYLRKGQKAEESVQAMAADLKKLARRIRTVAEQVRRAELEARRIVNEKND